MEPTIERQGSGFKLEWPSRNVTMRVRRIKPRGFKAEVAVLLNDQPVHRSNPTLDSVSGMDAFARKLNRRRPLDDYGVDWEQIVEDMSGIVIDTVRTGEPADKIRDVDLTDAVSWRIENVVLDNSCTLIWADGGTGKSMFATFLSVLAQEGHMSSEHGLIVEPSNVLFLDFETNQREIGHRIRMIHAGLGMDSTDTQHTNSNITYNKMVGNLSDHEDYIRDLIWEHNIQMVVIDSMGRAINGELNSEEAVIPFFDTIERLNTTVLLISHSNKQGTLFGSAYTNNSARLVWEAKRSSSGKTNMDFSLFCRKANNVPIQQPQSWGVDFSNDKAVYTRKDVFETEDAGGLSYMNLVYSILKEDGKRSRDYLKERIKELKPKDERGREIPTERTERNVDTAISKQKSKGAVIESNDGELALSQQTSEESESWQSI